MLRKARNRGATKTRLPMLGFWYNTTMKTYTTQGTCSRAIEYEVADGVLTACRFVGGCPGNTVGVAKLAVGRKVEDVISLLKGIPCRNGTSCPDQLARALEKAV